MPRLWVMLVLAACAPVPDGAPSAEVRQVILYLDTVTLLMADGHLCVVDRPGRAKDWSGVTLGCPYVLPVTVTAPPDAPRVALRPGGYAVFVSGQGWG